MLGQPAARDVILRRRTNPLGEEPVMSIARKEPEQPEGNRSPYAPPLQHDPRGTAGAAGDDRLVSRLGRGALGRLEAVLASWIAGTGHPRAGFLRWLWRMSNVITQALPENHPPKLKPPPVRFSRHGQQASRT